MAKVTDVAVQWLGPDYSHEGVARAFAALIPGAPPGYRLPMAPARVTVTMDNVSTPVANAVRRALASEMLGQYLDLGPDGVDPRSTDQFMTVNIVIGYIRGIRLCPQIPAATVQSLRFGLTAVNTTDAVVTLFAGDLVVTAGSLGGPIFNPTFRIGFLQPGKTLVLRDIRITEGYGHVDALYNVAARAALAPLDLATLPREATHSYQGIAAEQSGFVLSSMVAAPRRFAVAATIPAVPTGYPEVAVSVFADACSVVLARLKYAQQVLDAALGQPGPAYQCSAASYIVAPGDDGRTVATLTINKETDTLGALITWTVLDQVPGIGSATYDCTKHNDTMVLTVTHAVAEPADLGRILLRAVKGAVATLAAVRQGIQEFPLAAAAEGDGAGPRQPGRKKGR